MSAAQPQPRGRTRTCTRTRAHTQRQTHTHANAPTRPETRAHAPTRAGAHAQRRLRGTRARTRACDVERRPDDVVAVEPHGQAARPRRLHDVLHAVLRRPRRLVHQTRADLSARAQQRHAQLLARVPARHGSVRKAAPCMLAARSAPRTVWSADQRIGEVAHTRREERERGSSRVHTHQSVRCRTSHAGRWFPRAVAAALRCARRALRGRSPQRHVVALDRPRAHRKVRRDTRGGRRRAGALQRSATAVLPPTAATSNPTAAAPLVSRNGGSRLLAAAAAARPTI